MGLTLNTLYLGVAPSLSDTLPAYQGLHLGPTLSRGDFSPVSPRLLLDRYVCPLLFQEVMDVIRKPNDSPSRIWVIQQTLHTSQDRRHIVRRAPPIL